MPRDAAGVLDAVTASCVELHRWMSWAKARFGMRKAKKFCADARSKFEEGLDFTTLLILPSDHEIIGCASLLSRDAKVPSFELTYWLHTGYVGRATPPRPPRF